MCVEELGGGTGTSREALEDEAWWRGGRGGRKEREGAFLQSQCPLSSSSGACPDSPVLNHWPQGEGSPL